ncbi:MAG: lipoyl synthase [candidate division Zixibacteria bacterium]|nr:lipoyl synthase [candidate division Zixibacteria bacterium]
MEVRRLRWLKVRTSWGENYRRIKSLLSRFDLHTVCQEANCPNISRCFEEGTATFLILGAICTRGCKFCDVKRGVPHPVDQDEPRRVAEAVKELKLEYTVITSVTRDDLPDRGASIFAQTIREIRQVVPDCKIEVLIPDLSGSFECLRIIVEAKPNVLNHNMETVRRLYPRVRRGADYQRSLDLLRNVKRIDADLITKSGVMLGLGESGEEVLELMNDLRNVGCELLTIGQYLSPSEEHLPVNRFYHPDEFAELKKTGEKMGFAHVESGPLARSSYHAKEQAKLIKEVG